MARVCVSVVQMKPNSGFLDVYHIHRLYTDCIIIITIIIIIIIVIVIIIIIIIIIIIEPTLAPLKVACIIISLCLSYLFSTIAFQKKKQHPTHGDLLSDQTSCTTYGCIYLCLSYHFARTAFLQKHPTHGIIPRFEEKAARFFAAEVESYFCRKGEGGETVNSWKFSILLLSSLKKNTSSKQRNPIFLLCQIFSGWWSQIFFIMFTPTWGNDPIWLIFSRCFFLWCFF